jgi:hypothetical protein
MNPGSKENPGLNLPPPVGGGGEQLPLVLNGAAGAEARPETAARRPAGPERAPSAAAAGAAAAQPIIPLPPVSDNSAVSPQSDVTSASKSAAGGLIKDDDLIEKEWVDKAKRIVERTRDDPHQQSEQLTMVRADYMKKRYNKTIKVSK